MIRAVLKLYGDEERLYFWCPGCNGLMAVCSNRWHWNGDIENPTLSPSILQTIGPYPDGHKDICHCFVRDGKIEFCNDCTHNVRGTHELEELVVSKYIDFNGEPQTLISKKVT